MCILDFFFSTQVWKMTCYWRQIAQNLKIDQWKKKKCFCLPCLALNVLRNQVMKVYSPQHFEQVATSTWLFIQEGNCSRLLTGVHSILFFFFFLFFVTKLQFTPFCHLPLEMFSSSNISPLQCNSAENFSKHEFLVWRDTIEYHQHT